jgi:diguanylate cyclase (GGDEF)-like protein
LRILIIDEDDDDFLLLQALLARAEDATFLVDRAASSDNGLARLLEGGYDACLCDSSGGPQRDGLELIRMAQRRGCRTPIILTAGYADLGLQHEALEAGATDLIEKEEVDTERLDRAIRFAVARERRVARLTRLAQRDELTGLANGQLFADRLEQGLAAARRHRTLLAIMILDVDGFKTISDTVGHLAGDLLLLTVGERLRSRVRATDTVARLGSDEFAILIEDLARPDYSALVARKLLDAMAAPVVVGDREVTLSVSIGAAIYPRDGMDAATLLHHADAAMYRAKAEGGHLCCFHDELLDTRAQRGAVAAAELRRAIEQDELALHFQPQVTLCAPELGLASLVCWRHPDLGLIEPERIRQLAEDAGLLEPLTHWLIIAACRQARRWRDAGLRRLHIAVPLLSRRQLAWSQLASRLQESLLEAGLPAGWLELEVDERLLLEELAAGGAALPPLRELGVRLALDGFGGGPASLTVLRDAPLSTVKLSRAMLQGTPQDSRRTLFTGAVIRLAKELGLRLVAEGIESQHQLQMLRSHGCDAVQAFISCPPLPADACTNWLRQAAHRT